MARFIAFSGNPDIRSALLVRLAEHAAAGTIASAGDRWNGTGGTPSGCIAASGDPKAFEVVTGYPAGLGLLLDHLFARIDDPQEAATLAADWLGRAAPGSDLSGVPSRLVAFMLGEVLDGAEWTAGTQGVAAALRGILALHRRAGSGDTPTRTDWSAAQAAAIAATDAAADQLGRACGALAEAAAWDPLVSRSTLVDAAAKWFTVRALRASMETGWSDQDDAAFDACTETFQREVLAHDPSLQTTDFPPFFRAREPELHARFVRQLDRSNVAFLEAPRALARVSLDTLAAAPRPEAA
ncbi:MAG: hypothetical protein PGN25_11540 [Methylorubrum populi]